MRITVGDSISADSILWRYMSLDKLINLLETKKLFFTALEAYEKSDPFEGYMLDVAAEAFASILGYPVEELHQVFGSYLDQRKIEDLRATAEIAYEKIVKGVTVNCWHCNKVESEAMWKLYSDDGKGIAIKTSIQRLNDALKNEDFAKSIQISAVKYLDFSDPNITHSSCLTDGHLAPLLKRASYAHENEVRAFIINDVNAENLSSFKPEPDFVPVNLNKLIDAIYISPFATEPFISAVFAICDKYEIKEKVIKSNLLERGNFLSKLSAWQT